MAEQAPHVSEESTYILTMDLGEKLKSLIHIGIDAPGPLDDYTRDLQSELASVLQQAMPETKVIPVHMRDLADSVLGAAHRKVKDLGLENPVVVSTCPEIFSPIDGAHLQINRIFDTKGRAIGIGPRPGHPSLDVQIDSQEKQLRGKDVVIVEDGIFTGSTIRHSVNKLQEHGHETKAVVVGFDCKGTSLSWLKHTKYDLVTTEKFTNVKDWIPDHDFIPFVPGCGKVLGVIFDDQPYPFYDENRSSYATPYIQPYGPTAEWATIPHDKTSEVSRKCIELTRNLFETIVKLNPKEDITIGKLLNTRQRTSIPLPLGSTKFPALDTRVTDYLAQIDQR
ncbi:MAG: phosphoribosyltransferase family protein [Patescibacteria group bacterium]|nr:phosphoribosyltransferase family protein [Patescibacteria group bacterium]